MPTEPPPDPVAVTADLVESEFDDVVIERSGPLHVIVAIHNTVLGPALGGTRLATYPSEDAARVDAMRLARGMTHKSALAGLALGGGKAVIIGDPHMQRSEEFYRAYADVLNRLSGTYITAEDVGTTVEDMDRLRRFTEWVVGVSPSHGGRGDPSGDTALGVFRAMDAAAGRIWSDGIAGRHIAVQGLGKVGRRLADLLLDAGCRLTVADIAPDRTDELSERVDVDVAMCDAIHGIECDVFAPCALGAVLSDATIPQLNCRIVAGAANNQLTTDADAERLRAAGVCWVPDYLANAGGIIHVAAEWYDDDPSLVARRVDDIASTTTEILDVADRDEVSTLTAASRIVDLRLQRAETGR